MYLNKLAQDVCEASKHWYLPFLIGMVSYIRIIPKSDSRSEIGDLGDVPGDNILPKAILNSLISRRSL